MEEWKDGEDSLPTFHSAGLSLSKPSILPFLRTVNCFLKHGICERYNVIHLEDWESEVERRTGKRPQVTSARGHFLEVLLDYAGLRTPLRRNAKAHAAFQIVNQWHVGMRYYPATIPRPNAERFLEAVEVMRRWLLTRAFRWKGGR